MTQVEFIPTAQVIIEGRARKKFNPEELALFSSNLLSSEIGLQHPICLQKNGKLVSGERRFRVISMLHEEGKTVKFLGQPIPRGTIPAFRITNEFELLEFLLAESLENIDRSDFSWQEKAELDARIVRLKQAQIDQKKEAEKSAIDNTGASVPRLDPNSTESILNRPVSKQAVRQAAEELYGDQLHSNNVSRLEKSVQLSQALADPEMESKLRNAQNRQQAEKILAKEQVRQVQAKLAHSQGKSLRDENRHTAIHGDCLEELAKLETASIDLCLTDPIYGINAHKFGVAARNSRFHSYDDSTENFERILPAAIKEVSRILKPAAHMYLFCDLSKFYQLKGWIEEASQKDNPWTVQSFPIHWIKINGSRSPHPGFTWRKTVEYVVFAYRGGKQSNHQHDSHFEVSTSRTDTHAAYKDPSGLRIFLRNSAYPGQTVLDFMAGSGSIILAAQEEKMKSVVIEQDASSYGSCVQKIRDIQKGM